eukprot:gene11990-biopygen7259
MGAALCGAGLSSTVQYIAVDFCPVRFRQYVHRPCNGCCAVQCDGCSAVQCRAEQYCAVHCSKFLSSTVQCIAVDFCPVRFTEYVHGSGSGWQDGAGVGWARTRRPWRVKVRPLAQRKWASRSASARARAAAMNSERVAVAVHRNADRNEQRRAN